MHSHSAFAPFSDHSQAQQLAQQLIDSHSTRMENGCMDARIQRVPLQMYSIPTASDSFTQQLLCEHVAWARSPSTPPKEQTLAFRIEKLRKFESGANPSTATPFYFSTPALPDQRNLSDTMLCVCSPHVDVVAARAVQRGRQTRTRYGKGFHRFLSAAPAFAIGMGYRRSALVSCGFEEAGGKVVCGLPARRRPFRQSPDDGRFFSAKRGHAALGQYSQFRNHKVHIHNRAESKDMKREASSLNVSTTGRTEPNVGLGGMNLLVRQVLGLGWNSKPPGHLSTTSRDLLLSIKREEGSVPSFPFSRPPP
ncbi:hypothetical protein EDB89DRAFT_1634586 [Lactarius sanguifluus]|nr:hypothetical protein EDB89DRAFT_1634586 [Lactarius sanguifluus]